MAFIRSKSVKGNTYYQVVENYRDKERNGNHRQRVIKYLGKFRSVKTAIDDRIRREKRARDRAAEQYEEAEKNIEQLGRKIIGPIASYERPDPLRDPVASLVEEALSQLPTGQRTKVIEHRKICASLGKQLGLTPREVESRWWGEGHRLRNEYFQRARSIGKQHMPSREEAYSKYREHRKKYRRWRKEREAGRLTPEEEIKVRERLELEWDEISIPLRYHDALHRAKRHEEEANHHSDELNELLEIQRNYF